MISAPPPNFLKLEEVIGMAVMIILGIFLYFLSISLAIFPPLLSGLVLKKKIVYFQCLNRGANHRGITQRTFQLVRGKFP